MITDTAKKYLGQFRLQFPRDEMYDEPINVKPVNPLREYKAIFIGERVFIYSFDSNYAFPGVMVREKARPTVRFYCSVHNKDNIVNNPKYEMCSERMVEAHLVFGSGFEKLVHNKIFLGYHWETDNKVVFIKYK